MSKLDDLYRQLNTLSIPEAAELVERVERAWGVKATRAAEGTTPVLTPGPVLPPAEAQIEFDVVLTGHGERKIEVIKLVRELTSLGLKEAKDFVEKLPDVPLRGGLDRAQADKLLGRIVEAGGTAVIR